MLAKDIMTSEVITIGPEESIQKAASLMLENKISGIPVVDDKCCLLGIISENDLMLKARELQVPFFLTLFDSIIFLENPIRFNNDIKKFTASQVKDAMTKKTLFVEENTPVHEIVELMQNKRINRVPVLRKGKVIGIVSRNDILKTLVKNDG
jgi:CBS domain-containing protein